MLMWESLTEVNTRRHRSNLFVMDLTDIWSIPPHNKDIYCERFMLHRCKSKFPDQDGRNKENITDCCRSPSGYQWGRSNETIYVHVHESRDTHRTSQQKKMLIKKPWLLQKIINFRFSILSFSIFWKICE